MKRKSQPNIRLAAQQAKKAEHSRVFGLLDAVSQAKTDLEGTVQVMSLLIDGDKEYEEGVPSTIERWIKIDMGKLDRAFEAAWDGILSPINPRTIKTGG